MENIEKVVKNSYGTTVFRLVGDQFFFYLSESMATGNINDIYYIGITSKNAKVYLKEGGDFTVNSVYRYMDEIKKIIEDRLEQQAKAKVRSKYRRFKSLNNTYSLDNLTRKG